MEHKIVEKPAFTVVGMKKSYTPGSGEIKKLWEAFIPREGEIQHRDGEHVSYGLMGNYSHETGIFDYMAGFPVTSTADIPSGMESWRVPAGKYVVFTSCMKTLQADYDTIYNRALAENGYAHADTPDFELYDERFMGGEDDPFDIYVAIE